MINFLAIMGAIIVVWTGAVVIGSAVAFVLLRHIARDLNTAITEAAREHDREESQS